MKKMLLILLCWTALFTAPASANTTVEIRQNGIWIEVKTSQFGYEHIYRVIPTEEWQVVN